MFYGKTILQCAVFCLLFFSLLALQYYNGQITGAGDTFGYVTSIGVLFFAGVFCRGKRNRFAIFTFAVLLAVVYLFFGVYFALLPPDDAMKTTLHLLIYNNFLYGFLFEFDPPNSYLMILAWPISSYLGYMLFIYRHSISMWVNRKFNKQWPVGETNMTMVITKYFVATLQIDLLWTVSLYAYMIYFQIPSNVYVTDFIAEHGHFNFMWAKDLLNMIVSTYFCLALIVNTLTDIKRPDILGVGKFATYKK